MDFILQISNFLWGSVIGYALLGTGLYYSIRLGVPQLKYFKRAIGVMKNMKSADGEVSGIGTLCAAVGSQVGTGSLVGVASALVSGGPGAIFWMWITAIFGMVITFSETVLGQLFREKQADGTYRGGASYYIEKGLKSRPLAVLMAILYVFGIGVFIASLQTNSIASAFAGVVDINPLIPGLVVIALTGLVIVGGIKRLADVSSKLVPIMASAYILVVLYIIMTNISAVPSMFSLILESAFSPKAAAGGVIGHTVMQAFRSGTARGLFSNDAGNGTAGTMHASADVKHPVDQALLAMMGTFITTIIICTCTAFAILLTGVLATDNVGIHLLQESFAVAMGPVGKWVVFGAMFMFGFTTLLADIFYGETNIMYIFKEKSSTPIWIYRIVTAVILAVSCTMPLGLIWSLIDIMVALIVFLNLIALFKLFKYVRFAFDDYVRQLAEGIEEPEWEKDREITEVELDYKTI